MKPSTDWQRSLEDPITLPDGRSLMTLADARAYVLKLKPAQQESSQWQAAVEQLLVAAEGRGPVMFARIGMLKALHKSESR